MTSLRRRIVLAATGLSLAGGLAVAVPQPATATTCQVSWGSTAKSVTSTRHGILSAVRAGRHDCYDRLVLDVDRTGLGWRVRYVSAVHSQGSGAVLPLHGGAFLEVVQQSQATRRIAMPSVAGFTTFRQVGWGGSFEGYTTIGLGVRARLPFRAFESGNHLVVDVAHRW